MVLYMTLNSLRARTQFSVEFVAADPVLSHRPWPLKILELLHHSDKNKIKNHVTLERC